MSPLAISVLAVAIAVAIGAALVALGRSREREPLRPWWQHSAVWVGASVIVTLLGVFAFPKLLGFTFVFLPFLWMGGQRRRAPRPPNRSDREA